MRPFGCPITILNSKDHIGKFDGKADEGFFVGYSLNSKAFRVFNSITRIVEENLHIRFSESTPIVIGSGPDWLFDIDALTRTLNYEPIIMGTQSNDFAGTKASDNACQARKETEPVKEKEDNINTTNNVNTVSLTVNAVGTTKDNKLPFDPNMPALEDVGTFNFSNEDEDDDIMDVKSAFLYGKIEEEVYICQSPGFKDPYIPDRVYKSNDFAGTKASDNACQARKETEPVKEKEDNINTTNNVNTVSLTVNAVGTTKDNKLPFDPNMPALEDVGTFNFSNEDEDDDIVADMNYMDTPI
nr:ribonuclease H-like domain-containing protein [Tanacetum cinerariifolium]